MKHMLCLGEKSSNGISEWSCSDAGKEFHVDGPTTGTNTQSNSRQSSFMNNHDLNKILRTQFLQFTAHYRYFRFLSGGQFSAVTPGETSQFSIIWWPHRYHRRVSKLHEPVWLPRLFGAYGVPYSYCPTDSLQQQQENHATAKMTARCAQYECPENCM